MNTNKETDEKWVDVYTETLFDAFKNNQCVTRRVLEDYIGRRKNSNRIYIQSWTEASGYIGLIILL
jgi:hypothetical protein